MRSRVTSLKSLSALAVAAVGFTSLGATRPVEPGILSGLTWRNVGPFRAGRVAAVTGVIGQPGVFYIGLPLGGIWKTTSAGATWYPIFDAIKDVSSIGSVEVAPSDPNVIYVGTGDMITGGGINEGNGMYKSSDAGRTWTHLGLDDTRQIPSILVDPHDPNLVLIAAQGNIHSHTDMRGVFRSTDGGKTWTKTLFVNNETGLQKLAWAADHPSVMLATTVRHYVAPGPPPPRGVTGNAANAPSGTALYKSTDEGVTWKEITGGGLPALSGRTSIAVAMNTNAQRMFLISNAGLYRSDDGGTSWKQMDAGDTRIRNGQGGYNCGVYVDPKNPDIVYTINTSSYKSIDGGNTFTGFKGAPGGDDPQQLWIDPTNGQRMLLGLDQGATVTLDGGDTWSPWYNQSTDQVYHISTDASYPYWIYATQQDAGAIATRSRGNLGEITPLDWMPVPGWEWGTIVPDPLNTKIVYASGSGIVKISYPSEQWISVSPANDPDLKLRTTSSQPIIWAPWNQHELLAGFQYLMSTVDGGAHWIQLSPDLTVSKQQPAPVAAPGAPAPSPNGAIESISPSTVAAGTIWVGTNNGIVQVTRDNGKTWADVSIPGLPFSSRANIAAVDASHHDAATAYVAVDLHTTGDYTPYLYRTHDYGKTWTRIVDGLATNQPSGSFARVIRADTRKAGLLFAGTESSMYVSLDDGDHWQSFMFNLPNSSYRDIEIHGNDLIIGTYGRGIWILDDYSVLRQLTPSVASEPAHLFEVSDAVRVRRNVNADTPYPPEVPHALNPPDGAIIYYSLAAKPAGPVTLDVLDQSDKVIRHMSSIPAAPVAEAANPPNPGFWIAAPEFLHTDAGVNRANWDLRLDSPPSFTHSFEINANPGLTPASPEGPLAPPGVYTLRLTAGGKTLTQRVTVTQDPRSPASIGDVREQFALQMKFYDGARRSWDAHEQVESMRRALVQYTAKTAAADVNAAATALDAKLAALAGAAGEQRGFGGPPAPSTPSFVTINGTMTRDLTALDYGDIAPNEPMKKAYASACGDMKKAFDSWRTIDATELVALNATLAKSGAKSITSIMPVSPDCGATPARRR